MSVSLIICADIPGDSFNARNTLFQKYILHILKMLFLTTRNYVNSYNIIVWYLSINNRLIDNHVIVWIGSAVHLHAHALL